jgi:hypothetical protein
MIWARTEFREYERQLNKVEGLLGIAAAEGIDSIARLAHAKSMRNLRSMFTIRNRFTEGSMRYYGPSKERARMKLDGINAVTGTVSDYLPDQDSGARKTPRPGSRYIPMPTLASRGGRNYQTIMRKFRLSEIGDFRKKGSGFFVLPSGIYFRQGRKSKKPRAPNGSPKPLRPIVMIRTLGQTSQIIKKREWHTEAMKSIGTRENLAKAFEQAAKRTLAEYGPKTI